MKYPEGVRFKFVPWFRQQADVSNSRCNVPKSLEIKSGEQFKVRDKKLDIFNFNFVRLFWLLLLQRSEILGNG